MLKRKAYDKLLKWKNENKGSTALLVEGARRVKKYARGGIWKK